MFHQHGDPADVLRVKEQDLPQLGPHEVLVEMRAAPINPVDLNVIEGKYPVRPQMPAVAGSEGIGVVAEMGATAHGVQLGEHVILPQGVGTWREKVVVNSALLFPVTLEISVEQAAMLRINSPTAWRMLHDFVELRAGDWILQNAANSGVGHAVIQIAKSLGVRTINVVRRAELLDELSRAGGDVVLLDDEKLLDAIFEATNRAPILLALNAVGGESAVRLANALAPGGTLVTYGAMGRQPLKIPNGLLIFKDLRWRGFWITKWYEAAPRQEIDAMFSKIFPLAKSGVLSSPIEKIYGIEDTRAAIEHAQKSRRSGKILFRFGS